MTVVLKDNKGYHELHNITFVGKSSKKDCDYCAVDTFKHEFHFSHLQLIAIRG
jgi:hypothetical protein